MKMVFTAELPIPNCPPGQNEFEVHGRTLREAIEDITKTFPVFRPCLFQGKLILAAAWYINEVDAKELQGADTILQPDDIIRFVTYVSWI